MSENRMRRHWMVGGVRVTAEVSGDRRTVIVNGPGRSMTADSSILQGSTFESTIRQRVPAEVIEEVLAWLETPVE